MATYGKRRKGMLSSFSVFQDDKPEKDPNQHRSGKSATILSPLTLLSNSLAYARLGSVKTALTRTRSRAKLEDESGDDGGDTNEQHSSIQNYTATAIRPKSSKSTKTMTEDLDKPLPPIPHKSTPPEQLRQTRPALGTKTTNMQVPDKGRLTKADISAPIMNDNASTIAETSSRPETSGIKSQSNHTLKTSTADADELQRKITNLMMQAASQEEDTNRKAELYAAHPTKMSPFQRGKKAFVKATRAIKDRLSSHSNGTPLNLVVDSQNHAPLKQKSEASSFYDTDEDDTRNRLNRRIAEGQNLANPKIQAMVGDGNIPRKPLPVYESMKSRSQQSGSSDDPFSDGNEAKASPSPQVNSGFEIDFNRRTNENPTVKHQVSIHSQTAGILASSHQHLSVSQSTSSFSNMISGLAQHPDVMDFSSSPVGISTPRIRLEPEPLSGSKWKTGALSRSPSILEFSFEGKSDDEKSLALSTNSKSITDGSQSVKRKSAHDDLRSPVLPANKKSKFFSVSSNEEASLAIGISRMDTEDEQAPLSSKDRNAMLGPPGRPANKGRGLNIFDLGKGKAPESKRSDESKARPRPIIGRRSSLPRPGSILFNGRDPRPGLKRLTSVDTDSVDIDELQMNDAVYQVGGKKR